MSLSASVKSRLQHQHGSIHQLLNGFSDEYLKQQIHIGKWSVHEQVAHLATYQPLFYGRLKRIEQENNPSFERYIADNDPAFQAFCQKPLAELLQHLQQQRIHILDYLFAVPDEILSRTGRHPRYGQLTVNEWTEFFLLHEAHHLFSIFMLTRTVS